MKKIALYFLNHYLRSHSRKNRITHPWKDIRTIAILSDVPVSESILQSLQSEGKSVLLLPIPTRKQIVALLQRPKQAFLYAISSPHYDLLLDLTQQPTLPLLYMAAAVKADFKVGKKEDYCIHDFMIDTPSQPTPDYLYEQILRYFLMFNPQ